MLQKQLQKRNMTSVWLCPCVRLHLHSCDSALRREYTEMFVVGLVLLAAPSGTGWRLSGQFERLVTVHLRVFQRWNLFTDFLKEFFDIGGISRAGFYKNSGYWFCKLLGLFHWDFPDVSEVVLVPCYGHHDVLRAVLLQLFHPLLQRLERIQFSDIINYNSSCRSSVVHGS